MEDDEVVVDLGSGEVGENIFVLYHIFLLYKLKKTVVSCHYDIFKLILPQTTY